MNLPCIKCGESGAVRVSVDDGDAMTCGSCDGEFTVEDVQELIDSWGPVLVWLRAHPARQSAAGG